MSTKSSETNENLAIDVITLDEQEEDNVASDDYEPSMCNCDLCYMSREIYEYMHESRENEGETEDILEENEEDSKEDSKEDTKEHSKEHSKGEVKKLK